MTNEKNPLPATQETAAEKQAVAFLDACCTGERPSRDTSKRAGPIGSFARFTTGASRRAW